MKVSVVLQTFNNDNRILKTINSIRSQKNIKNYEIIIFDDRSTNKNFLKYLKFLSKKYKVKIIRPKKNYFSNNLNPGDFTGGGTYFPKYKCLVNPTEIGMATLHPGNITHKHGARPTTSGTRYVVVSFISNSDHTGWQPKKY